MPGPLRFTSALVLLGEQLLRDNGTKRRLARRARVFFYSVVAEEGVTAPAIHLAVHAALSAEACRTESARRSVADRTNARVFGRRYGFGCMPERRGILLIRSR